MASLFSHAAAALAIGACFYRPGVPKRVWALGAFAAALAAVLGPYFLSSLKAWLPFLVWK